MEKIKSGDCSCLNGPKRPVQSLKMDELHRTIVSYKFFGCYCHGNHSLIMSFRICSPTSVTKEAMNPKYLLNEVALGWQQAAWAFISPTLIQMLSLLGESVKEPHVWQALLQTHLKCYCQLQSLIQMRRPLAHFL